MSTLIEISFISSIAFQIYDVKRNGKLTADSFCRAVCHTLGITQEYGLQIFDQVDRKQLGFVRLGTPLTYQK